MLRKINVFTDKTLKLSNVVITPIKLEDCKNIDTCINKIENFIKSKGSLSLGPLIQKIEYYVNEDGNLDVNVFIMRQIPLSLGIFLVFTKIEIECYFLGILGTNR